MPRNENKKRNWTHINRIESYRIGSRAFNNNDSIQRRFVITTHTESKLIKRRYNKNFFQNLMIILLY